MDLMDLMDLMDFRALRTLGLAMLSLSPSLPLGTMVAAFLAICRSCAHSICNDGRFTRYLSHLNHIGITKMSIFFAICGT